MKGVKEGDFTCVYGFPGSTRQYVTSNFVDYTLNHSSPAKIKLRTIRLDIIKAAQDADPAVRIMYASKAASIANSWKKWQGESLGLERLGTVGKKRDYEMRFQQWADIHTDGAASDYSGILPELHAAYDSLLPYAMGRDYYVEALSAIELVGAASRAEAAADNKDWFDTFYKNYSPEIDRAIAKRLMKEYVDEAAPEFQPEYFVAAIA